MLAARDWTQRSIESTTAGNQDIYQDIARKMNDIALKLKNCSFKDIVMKECAGIFYRENFENELDANINLVRFDNGIYDPDTIEFREGRLDD